MSGYPERGRRANIAGRMDDGDGNEMRDDLLPCLRCPVTGSPLRAGGPDGGLVSEDGSRSYRILGGAPVLIDFERSVVPPPGGDSGAILQRQAARPEPPLSWLMSGSRLHVSGQNVTRMVELMGGTEATPARLLVIGAGSSSPEVAALAADPRVELVATDVQPGTDVSVICDAHELPFADGTMDGVMSQWVLEHVVDPERVVREIHRVLKPDGIVYSEVPFMQQVHFGRFDFNRWSPSGHRRLYRWFDEISMSIISGPGMALSWSFVWFLKSFPSREGGLSKWLGRFGRVLTLPFLLCDRWLIRRPGSWDAASGTSFTGRRREEPVEDAEIVASYRGLNDYYLSPESD